MIKYNVLSTDRHHQVEDYVMSEVAHDYWKGLKLFTDILIIWK